MSAGDRFLSEAQLRAKYGDAEYEKRRSIGAFGVAIPQENYSAPGAPAGFVDPATARDAIEALQELEDAQQPLNPGSRVLFSARIGPEDEVNYTRLFPGRAGSYRGLDVQAQNQAEEREIRRQAFLQAGKPGEITRRESLDVAFGPGSQRPTSAQEALQQIIGGEVSEYVANRAQQYAEVLNIGPRAAYRLVLAENGLADLPESLVNKIASTGEIGPDPVASAVASGLNREVLRQRRLARDEPGFDENSDNTVPVLPESALQAVSERVDRAVTGMPSTPFRQLSAEETAEAAAAEGAGKTRGGRRNALRKDAAFPEEAAVLRRPGSVLSMRMEPNPANFLMPFLIAPKNQQAWSEGADQLRGDDRVMQVAQYNAGKNAQGRAMWRPSLRDARTLYVNPYGELPDAVMARAGLDMVPYLPEKDESGAMDQKALNVPIPDVDGTGGFRDPAADPGYGMRNAVRYRNPTLAEAVQSLLLQNSTPIKAYTEDAFVDRGAGYQDRIRMPDGSTVPVYALGTKRDAAGKPLPISAYFQEPAWAPKESSPPRVADVRVGSANRYTPEFFTAFDDLLSGLAETAYGRAPVAAELAGPEQYQPVRGVIPADKVRYGSLMNLAGNADIKTAAAFQRKLLDESGFPVPGQSSNPLMEMVGILKDLGAAPPTDAPVRNVAMTGAQAEPIVAPAGLTGTARLLQDARREKLSTMAAKGPTTSRARQMDENAAYSLLDRMLTGDAVPAPRAEVRPPYGVYRDNLAIPGPRYRQSVIPGLEEELRFPQTTPADPVARDVLRYMQQRLPVSPPANSPTVIQYVPASLMQSPAAPVGVVQEPAATFIAETPDGEGTWYVDGPAPRASSVLPAPAAQTAEQLNLGIGPATGGVAPSYVDQVSRYMRRFPPATQASQAPSSSDAVQLELLRRGRSGEFGRMAPMRIGRP